MPRGARSRADLPSTREVWRHGRAFRGFLAKPPPVSADPRGGKGHAGLARSAVPNPSPRGPEVEGLRAPWAGPCGAGAQRTCCISLLCASGRALFLGSARRHGHGGRDTGAPRARPCLPSRQSTRWLATHRFSASAMPCLLLSRSNTGGETPVSPEEGASSLSLQAPSARDLPSCALAIAGVRDGLGTCRSLERSGGEDDRLTVRVLLVDVCPARRQ